MHLESKNEDYMRKIVTFMMGVLFILTFNTSIKAQNDCCGLGSIFQNMMQSGIFGGYGIQKFSAEGLNNYIHNTPGLDQNFKEFGTAWGWRAGANILGFRSSDILVALKFYFQSVSESQEADGTYDGVPATEKLKLDINSWNVGMSLSYILNPNFDLRIFDIYLTWTNVKFTNEIKSINAPPKDEYKTPDTHTGFTADAGFVWYPFPPYLSVEVLGGYSIFAAERVDLKNGGRLNTSGDFIDGGGFFAAAVLTVGIPFE